jgi:hypothetical protein
MFGGNSSYAINVFCVQKRALRIMMGIGSRDSCRQLFITLGILPLQSQYIYSLLSYMVNNMDSYQFISDLQDKVLILIFINLQPIGQYISRELIIWLSGYLIIFLFP